MCKQFQICHWISLAIYAVTFVMFLVVFSVPNWMILHHDRRHRRHIGLWAVCYEELDTCYNVLTHAASFELFCLTYYKATQALMCLALVAAVVAGVGYGLAFIPNFKPWYKISFGSQLTAGFLCVISLIVFGANHDPYTDYEMSWAFWLLVICTVLFLGSGILLAFVHQDTQIRNTDENETPNVDGSTVAYQLTNDSANPKDAEATYLASYGHPVTLVI